MKKLLALCLIFCSASLFARDISDTKMEKFSSYFKDTLNENSYSGLFCYSSASKRRIIGADSFSKEINLGDSSNIITNYLAYTLEENKKFDRYKDLRKYAQVFNYNSREISFADLISSTAGISKHLDKIYPADASSEEYFDFLFQLSPELNSDSKYEYSKLSNLGAIYALSYSQDKKVDKLMPVFENLVGQYLSPTFPSLKLTNSQNNLDINFSMNLRDFSQYLAKEAENFRGKPRQAPLRAKVYNGWIFSEIELCRIAMVGGIADGTFIIANFYDLNISVAIFIDEAKDEKARKLAANILQRFAKELNY